MKLQTRTKRILLGLALLVVAGGAGWFVIASNWPGGIRSTYQPKDQDRQLTEFAKTALPVIEELERFRAANKFGFVPTNATELVVSSAGRLKLDGFGYVNGWGYELSSGPLAYELRRKLGWDTKLVYRFNIKSGVWVFEPGDGSPEKVIALKP